MKKYLRVLAVGLVIVVLGLMLVACGNNETSPSPSPENSSDVSPVASVSPSAQ